MTEDMYNKSCHTFYYDDKSDEYKLAEPYECYEKLYRYDDDLEQFVEIDLAAIKNYAEKEEEKVDNVNHPKHYEGSCSIECIDAMRFALGDEGLAFFCAGNVFKYLWRYKFKNGQEDLDKAEWYFNKLEYLSRYENINNQTIKLLLNRVIKLYLTVTRKKEDEEMNDIEDEEDKDDE